MPVVQCPEIVVGLKVTQDILRHFDNYFTT
jgi:hypothetical protein